MAANEPTTLEADIIAALNKAGWSLTSWNVTTGDDYESGAKCLTLNVVVVAK